MEAATTYRRLSVEVEKAPQTDEGRLAESTLVIRVRTAYAFCF